MLLEFNAFSEEMALNTVEDFPRNFAFVLRTTTRHMKFHRFLFPFSSKLPDLNFAIYVLSIYACYETRA